MSAVSHGRRLRFLERVPRRLGHEGLNFAQHVRDGRFQRSLSLITAVSALLGGIEVGYQHYRSGFGNRVMYTPVLLTPPLVIASLWTVTDRRAAQLALPAVSAIIVVDGLVGCFFHLRGVARKPGGWRLPVTNVVMGPPLLAPILFALPGYLGLMASALHREEDPRPSRWRLRRLGHRSRKGVLAAWRHELREGRFEKHLAAATAMAAFCSGFEALYSHYKNNFRVKAQWTPVLIAPLLTAAGVWAVFSRRAAHTFLPAVSVMAMADGVVGSAYHARGILRRPGGAKHAVYNVMYGPPVFAPLLFAAAGFLGVLASLMRRER